MSYHRKFAKERRGGPPQIESYHRNNSRIHRSNKNYWCKRRWNKCKYYWIKSCWLRHSWCLDLDLLDLFWTEVTYCPYIFLHNSVKPNLDRYSHPDKEKMHFQSSSPLLCRQKWTAHNRHFRRLVPGCMPDNLGQSIYLDNSIRHEPKKEERKAGKI